MARRKYVSRKKERVAYVHHSTKLDGTVEHDQPPYRTYLEWVYTDGDGREFVNQAHPIDVRRLSDGAPAVDRYSKEIQPVDIRQVLSGLMGPVKAVSLGGGLVALVPAKGGDDGGA